MNRNLSQENFTSMEAFLQPIIENGSEGILEVMRQLFNAAMQIERSKALNAGHYERSAERRDYANGYKPKTLNTRMGSMTLNIPQTRNSDFYPSCLEKGLRSERALNCAIAQMYIEGVSTRKVESILKELCGLEISASQVSRVTGELDAGLAAWRNRPLGSIKYLLLDARHEKVRVDRVVRDCALLIAYGVDMAGRRTVLGVDVALSEAEVHWRAFLQALAQRGLCGLKLITSDDHTGLKAARTAVFPSVPWQRCQFHLQQNASAHVPKKAMQQEVHGKIKTIFNAPDQHEAERLLRKTGESFQETAPELAEWMEDNLPEGFTVFALPELSEAQRKKLRTTNMVEFQNKELKKRTRVIKVFPDKEALLRIASAMLVELDEKWQADDKAYIGV